MTAATMRCLELVLWLGAIGGVTAGTLALVRPPRHESAPLLPSISFSEAAPRPSIESLGDAVSTIEDGNLFRPDRAPPEELESLPSALGPPAPPSVARPALVLRGLLGGPPWDAIVEGIPGREGAVVLRLDQPTAGFTLRAVRRDTAIIHAPDTTWTLTLRRAW